MKEIKNEYVDQIYDTELKVLYANFHKFGPFSEYLPIFENGYEIIQMQKAKGCLINIERVTVHDEQTRAYLGEVWFPKVSQEGVTHIAIVLPSSALGRISSQKAHESAEIIGSLTVCNFDRETEAREWLSKMLR